MEIAICDTECYPNYWLCKFLLPANGAFYEFEQYEGKPLDIAGMLYMLRNYTIVTFNGINYDLPVISLAAAGASCARLKEANDLIIMGGLKWWEIRRQYGIELLQFDHIDLMEAAPSKGTSLKLYAGRLHAPKMQDLPYTPSDSLTLPQMREVALYCGNDLQNTYLLYCGIKDRLDLRQAMGESYGLDLRSKSDAQMAEAVFKHKLGQNVQRPHWPHGTMFKYEPPAFISFASLQLRELLAQVRESYFTISDANQVDNEFDCYGEKIKTGVIMPDVLRGAQIVIGQTAYKIGIGGIHSRESNEYYDDSDGELMDADVTGYYPSLILLLGLFPEHLGPEFLVIFREFVEDRNEAKLLAKLGDLIAKSKSDGLKIVCNGTFGKLLAILYSILSAPKLGIAVTMTGQFSLLMLIERLELSGIRVVSANTDGIIIKCPRGLEWLRDIIIKEWEKTTGLNMEFNSYKAIYSRDINNYVAFTTSGKVKGIGAFAGESLKKNPDMEICYEALREYWQHGTSIEQTICACRDIRKFVIVRKVQGGAVYGDEYLGKVVRWYLGTGRTLGITYKVSGNQVPDSKGAVPCMDLPDSFPADVDYKYYISTANELRSKFNV